MAASAIGVVCGLIGTMFHFGVHEVTAFRGTHPWVLYLLPLAGFVIVSFYKLTETDGLGTDDIIDAVHEGKRLPILLLPAIFFGTVLTHLCGGSAGREGAALQMGGTIGQCMGRTFRLDDRDLRVATLAGMAAFFSALFGTPLAATVFAIMVISIGVLYHVALYPSLLAALVAYGVSVRLGGAYPLHRGGAGSVGRDVRPGGGAGCAVRAGVHPVLQTDARRGTPDEADQKPVAAGDLRRLRRHRPDVGIRYGL